MHVRREMRLALATIFAILAIMAAGAMATDYYVKTPAQGGSNGNSGEDWGNAFATIQQGVDSANASGGGTARVAAGTYAQNITMKSNVTLWGGYPAGGGDESERHPATNTTTIDGNNAGSVVTISSKTGVTIDGFKITRGLAYNGGGIYCYYSSPAITTNDITGNTAGNNGGGIYCDDYSSPTITECVITGNESLGSGSVGGGGIAARSYSSATISNCTINKNKSGGNSGGIQCWYSSPTITNCTVSDNTSVVAGGGILCDWYSSPTIKNCTISGNTTGWLGGGGINCYMYSLPTITNCLVTGNTAPGGPGGGICCRDHDSPTITNCTFGGNQGSDGGGVYVHATCSPVVTNSILWDDTASGVSDEISGAGTVTVNYSDVEGGWSGTSNIHSDPLFVGGYYLSHIAAGQADNSPCIDAGSDTAANLDLDGRATRVDGVCDAGTVDMGYHYPGECSELRHYVRPAGDDSKSGDSWAEAFKTIQKAIDACTEGTCDDPDVIHVAEGTYHEKIVLDSNITVLGGYPAGGGGRDPEAHETIIDAHDLGGSVVTINGKNCVTIDGFTITNGSATNGGGIDCISSSSLTITNNTIRGNASTWGGGINCNDCSPTITNNMITGNNAAYGGGIMCHYGSASISNNMITANYATYGGGIHGWTTSLTLTNCTIADNRASGSDSGGGFYCDADCTATVQNSILWGDSPDEIRLSGGSVNATYCNVQGGWMGTGNIDKDPGFVPLDGSGKHTGYYLMHLGPQAKDSACVDAGDADASVYGLDDYTTRTDGVLDDGKVDMGYHYPCGYTGGDNTYIQFASFTARPVGASIVLDWETGAEIDNAGFVVYRAVAGTFDYQQLSGLIPAQGTPTSGASYSFTDSNVEPGVSYNYWLVDIDTSGKWTVHGPASARLSLSVKPLVPPTANSQQPTVR